MALNVTTVLKWAGYLDGAAVGAAVAFGKLAPQYASITDSIVGIGATITSILGILAHVTSGSASGGGASVSK